MNQLLITHQQRQHDRQEILIGIKRALHLHSQAFYFERQRLRHKKELNFIGNLKKSNKSIISSNLKKVFLSNTITIMNSYLNTNLKTNNSLGKLPTHYKTVEDCEESEPTISVFQTQINAFRNLQMLEKLQDQQSINQNQDSQLSLNFYQTYINLFVNFFNFRADIDNLNTIKSIIRPNNRYVILDLLKALLEFCKNDMKLLVKETFFFQPKLSRNLVSNPIRSVELPEHNRFSEAEQIETIIDFQSVKDLHRRVQTEPEVVFPQRTDLQLKKNSNCINQTKQLRTKNSSANFLKTNSTEIQRQKNDEVQELNSRYLHAHFIQKNIKQTMYQRNFQFATQINLEKLQSRINNIYIQLNRLNIGNSQTINQFYEENVGKKNKFNYDPRGLYSETQKYAKKQLLLQEILQFQQRPVPTKRSNTLELTEYANEFSKYKGKSQELTIFEKSKNKSSKTHSGWLPLKIYYSQEIIEPLKLYIEQINPNNSEILSYHWKKYRKQFSITEFLKQKLKLQYQKIQQRHAFDKSIDNELFKKKKFRKSLFLDNRKKINDLIQSNNVIFTKKQSIFPVLKGIQQNFIKNSNTNAVQSNYALESDFTRSKDSRKNFNYAQKLKFNQDLTCKASAYHHLDPKDKEKRFQSIKRVFQGRERSQRKLSESEKLLGKIPEKDKEKIQLLQRLSVKYDFPIGRSSRNHKNSQKQDKKNLISISKIIDIRADANEAFKTVEMPISSDKKLTILNLS